MNYLLLFFVLLTPVLSFSQLTGSEHSFSVESSADTLEDNSIVTGSRLILNLTPDDNGDLLSIAVNLYEDGNVSVMNEVVIEGNDILPLQNVTTGVISVPLMVIDPARIYTITYSLRNSNGEYLPTVAILYPN